MASCAGCGREMSFWSRDILTGQCRSCRDRADESAAARRVTLGWGTLLLLGVVVAAASWAGTRGSRGSDGDLQSEVRRLQATVGDLKTEVGNLRAVVSAESTEIALLRMQLAKRPAGGKGD